jgi:hypothetical protein
MAKHGSLRRPRRRHRHFTSFQHLGNRRRVASSTPSDRSLADIIHKRMLMDSSASLNAENAGFDNDRA